MKTILTGIRPTGNQHIGHYLGTIKNWVEMQDDYNFYLEIADVQALTDNFHTPQKVVNSIMELAIDLLACGIDPKKVTIFVQSGIPAIAEITIYFSNLVTMARLYRNPTVKTEISQKKNVFGKDGEGVTYGFVGYPISQAADITAFKGEIIPVGEDQLPLIEQTREIVRKFNTIYSGELVEPTPLLGKFPRIKGLDGNEKMGKSLGNAIYLKDSEEIIKEKVMMAKTDPQKVKKDDKADPDICMVYYYHKLFNQDNLETICSECKNGNRGCVQCKKELANKINDYLKPIRDKRTYYEEHKEEVETILKEGTLKARIKSEEVLKEIKKDMQINYTFLKED